jgi:shikimate dehydrogenase
MPDAAPAPVQRVGLLGWPVAHSVSPAMHNAAFDALGLCWRYDLLPAPPDELIALIDERLAEGYRGFNVTLPHKRAVLGAPQIAEIDRDVQDIGAANTLTVLPGGGLRASNTDWRALADDLAAQGVAVGGARCLVLGTGGSSEAAVYALQRQGAKEIVRVSRQPAGRAGVISYDQLRDRVIAHPPSPEEKLIVVNCTPVGMFPKRDESRWPDELAIPQPAICVDLIYNPPETRFIRQARAAGATAIGGLGMLVRQGALSFEMWTGVAPPLDVMRRAARRALGMAEEG